MKKLILPFLVTAAVIIGVGLYTKSTGSTALLINPPKPTPVTKEITVAGRTINVEVADNEQKRKEGLGNRDSLDPESGMLFTFDQDDIFISFWMKDTKIPLDIIWIDNGKVVKIHKNVQPEPGVNDDKLKLYSPDKPIDQVLEVNAGYSDKYNIKVGDEVVLP